MNKDAILGFIKKNVLSLCCAAVAIAAVVLLFYPLGGWVTDLKADADQHAGMYNTLNGFIKSRKMPISDPYKADPGDLKSFPNAAFVEAGTNANKKWADYSNQMLKDVQEMNRKGHDLLVPGELPNSTSQTTLFRFAQVYKQVLSTDPAATASGDATATPPIIPDQTLVAHNALNLRNDVLHGGLPPTPAEIQDALKALWTGNYQMQLILQNGQEMNRAEVEANYKLDAAGLPQRMKDDVATKHKVYVEHDAFTVSPSIQLDVIPRLDDVWYAQMSLWMQRDLCDAIAEANGDSKNILDAEVKRVISMQIPIPPNQLYTFPPPAAGQSAGPTDLPSAAKDTDLIPANFLVSPTGRYSNGMYDVAKFRLVVDLDATRVNQFIETLSKNRLISVYLENEYAVDSEAEALKGYLYGSSPAVRCVFEGEMLFMRSWTAPLMPDHIKMAMGLIAIPTGGIPGGAPGGQPGGMPMPGPYGGGMPNFGGPGGPR